MPILHSNLETDLRLAVTLDQALLVLLTDMGSIRRTGAIAFLGAVNGTGSDTHRIRLAGLGGRDHMAATAAEDTDVAETTLADDSADIAVARNSLVRQVSDLAVLTGFVDDIDPEALATDMVSSYERRFNDVAAAAVATAATTVGTSGADMVTDDFYDAIYTLQLSSVPTPYFSLLHPRQVADLVESIRGEGGAAQWLAATQAMLDAKGPGYQGSWLGVDIFASSDVTAGGGNRKGGMWGAGALAYKTGEVDSRSFIGSGTTVVQQGEVLVEIGRVLGGGRTKIAGDAYFGVSVIEQARLVGIFTDD